MSKHTPLFFIWFFEKNTSFVHHFHQSKKRWEVRSPWPGPFLELRGGFCWPIFQLADSLRLRGCEKEDWQLQAGRNGPRVKPLDVGLCLGGLGFFLSPKKMVGFGGLVHGRCVPQNDFRDEFRFRNCRDDLPGWWICRFVRFVTN